MLVCWFVGSWFSAIIRIVVTHLLLLMLRRDTRNAAMVKGFGRRKSWIVPIQICSAILLLFIAQDIDTLLSPRSPTQSHSGTVNITYITTLFFTLVMLAATQDIAVDGMTQLASFAQSVLCSRRVCGESIHSTIIKACF